MTPEERIKQWCQDACTYCDRAKATENKEDNELYLKMAIAKLEAALNEIPTLMRKQEKDERRAKEKKVARA